MTDDRTLRQTDEDRRLWREFWKTERLLADYFHALRCEAEGMFVASPGETGCTECDNFGVRMMFDFVGPLVMRIADEAVIASKGGVQDENEVLVQAYRRTLPLLKKHLRKDRDLQLA